MAKILTPATFFSFPLNVPAGRGQHMRFGHRNTVDESWMIILFGWNLSVFIFTWQAWNVFQCRHVAFCFLQQFQRISQLHIASPFQYSEGLLFLAPRCVNISHVQTYSKHFPASTTKSGQNMRWYYWCMGKRNFKHTHVPLESWIRFTRKILFSVWIANACIANCILAWFFEE